MLVEGGLEFTGLRFPARDTIRAAVRLAFGSGFVNEERFSLMVASFSKVGDQLSQWRGYAGDSTGVSLGLDLRHLRPPSAVHTTVVFATYVYQGAEKKHLLGAILDHCRERLEAAWNSTVTSGLKNIDRSNPKAVWNHIHEYSKKISTSVGDAPMEINVKVVLDAHFTPVSGCLLMPTTLLNAAKSLATLFSAQPRGRYAWLDLLGTDTRTARQ